MRRQEGSKFSGEEREIDYRYVNEFVNMHELTLRNDTIILSRWKYFKKQLIDLQLFIVYLLFFCALFLQ